VLSESATACSASEGRKVGDLVWGLAHLEVDGLSCDPTVGLRSADVETTGTKLCECSTATMSSRPFPHWVRTHCQLGQTPAGGQVRTPRRGSASAASVTLTDAGAARSSYGTWPSSCAREFGSIRRTRSSAATRSGRGAVCPRSHCDTEAWETPSVSASPRCDRRHSSRARWSACPNRRRCSAVATLRPLPRCLLVAISMPDRLTANRLWAVSRRNL
jgi:hypothetical protein